MPIYYAVYTYISEPETYWWPLNREVKIQYATSLIWAVTIGYIIPTILMFVPWTDPNTIQNFEAVWQMCPMSVPLICGLLAYSYARRHNLKPVPPIANQVFSDLAHLNTLYIVSGILGLMLHVYCLTRISFSRDMSLTSVFWPDFSMQPKAIGEGIRAVFLADFWGFYLATYAWLCMAVWDVKRMGRTSVDVGKASTLIALSSGIIGPGATMSMVWYWREAALAKTSFAQCLT